LPVHGGEVVLLSSRDDHFAHNLLKSLILLWCRGRESNPHVLSDNGF